MSDRKSLLTSISSELGEEFFRRVATTFRITEGRRSRRTSAIREEPQELEGAAELQPPSLTGVLDLDGGVGLRVGLVDHLGADLLRQNLQVGEEKLLIRRHRGGEKLELELLVRGRGVTSYRVL